VSSFPDEVMLRTSPLDFNENPQLEGGQRGKLNFALSNSLILEGIRIG
tara:strand:- start:340 stop:483 length:144 start_codon:yes stop_codon:yes gene_type:complete